MPPPCFDNDKDGYGIGDITTCVKHEVDCNDNNVAVYPGAKEICDKKDNDCDGQTDEDQNQWNEDCGICTDVDGDGYDDCFQWEKCLHADDMSNEFCDCDDNDAQINPSAQEIYIIVKTMIVMIILQIAIWISTVLQSPQRLLMELRIIAMIK